MLGTGFIVEGMAVLLSTATEIHQTAQASDFGTTPEKLCQLNNGNFGCTAIDFPERNLPTPLRKFVFCNRPDRGWSSRT